jgi:hypothetical protein
MKHSRILTFIVVAFLSSICFDSVNSQDAKPVDAGVVAEMAEQATSVLPLVKSELATSFLRTAEHLTPIEPFTIYVPQSQQDEKNPVGISVSQWDALSEQEQRQFVSRKITERKYYFTKYGTPVAFVRAVEIVGKAGLSEFENKKVVDFGFGSIGHLRMMAMCGATVRGIDVDLFLQSLYRKPRDQGEVKSDKGVETLSGSVKLSFGKFPVDATVATEVGGDIDLFVSKNTLKRGYIHPAQEVDPRRKIELGVSDEDFVAAVYERLKPGGFFLIYNFHPKRTEPGKKYITWSDGRCPFERSVVTNAGFEILAFDEDDTEFAHAMATAFGWNQQMDLDKDFRATYTLLKK